MTTSTAMILAAGRGERLKPLTDSIPKAMCRVNGIPLIEYHVTNLAKAGFARVVINHAHLGGQIRQHLGDGSAFGLELCYAPEPPGGLETGGGIFNALPLLGKDPFLTVNADIYTDFDFHSLHLLPNSLVNLVLVKNPQQTQSGDFGLDEHHRLTPELPRHTFSGIATYHPDAFLSCSPGRYSVTPLLRKLMHEHKAFGKMYAGLWVDIGTSARLKYVNEMNRVAPEPADFVVEGQPQ